MQALIRIFGNNVTEINKNVQSHQMARGIAKRNLRQILYLNGSHAIIWIDGIKYATIRPGQGNWETKFH